MSEKTSTSEEVNIKQKKLIATLLALFLGSF
jgi:hypothetical protein